MHHTHQYRVGEHVVTPLTNTEYESAKRDPSAKLEHQGRIVRIHPDRQPMGSHSVDVQIEQGGTITFFEGQLKPARARKSCMCPYCLGHE